MDSSKISLEGKVALITGAGRMGGIGRTIALTFADAGADVALNDREPLDMEEITKEIQAKGRRGLAVVATITKTEDLKNLVEKVKAELGRIDILVNNAGTDPYAGPVIDAPEWAYDVTMGVNLKAPFLLSQLVARIMREQGGGNIINMASTAGLHPGAGVFYSVSKAGLIMLTGAMAKELGQYNIRVNAIGPGTVKTRFSAIFFKKPGSLEAAEKANALHRLGEPEDVARVALFLASDLAKYVNGATIVVDGGGSVGLLGT